MTTIAYCHKDREIAVDSRATRGNIIDSDNDNKLKIVNGVTFIMTGKACDYQLLIDIYFGVDKTELVPDCCCMVIDDGKFYEFSVESDGSTCRDELVSDTAFGSGASFALAAMDFGCNAKDAVKYAKTRDCKTGGRVRVFKVK